MAQQGSNYHTTVCVKPFQEGMKEVPNGVRYPRVGGRRRRHFAGTSLQPRTLPENAVTPTRRVHAVLARPLIVKLLFDSGSSADMFL